MKVTKHTFSIKHTSNKVALSRNSLFDYENYDNHNYKLRLIFFNPNFIYSL